jgi:hypothetical protein
MDRDPRTDPPDWWDWPLTFTAHVEARMEERQFSEVELRTMFAAATRISDARRPGRFLIACRHRDVPWTVVVEPDPAAQLLFVVTAFPRSNP